ncbi:MAG: ATPase [Ilumatobacteraceae bacterium]|nr:ATPase [Ilumatobacteraceae bacterium]
MTANSTTKVDAASRRRIRPLSGVRGRVVLTVLLVTAVLYSLLGSIGFLYIADSGRDAIRERVTNVLDQLEATLRSSGTVSIATPDGVTAIATTADAQPLISNDDVVVRRTITVGSTSVLLIGSASQARLTESLHSLYRGLWIGVPLGVLLTSAIAGLATRRALRPVSVITELAATIEAGDSAGRVPVPDTDDEIEHLARTVNEMLDRIEAGRVAQRQFTSDAAHELRTPLMALQGEIELAVRAPTAADDAFLARIGALGDRLARRVDDLVLLSTLDEQPPLRLADVDVLGLVRTEAAMMPNRGDADGANPVIEIVGDPTSVTIDERLVSRALRNLLANACRHAEARVRVEVATVAGQLWVHVDDDGPGVAAEDREVILRRFGRLDEARAADGGGAGLGLAIVASVVRAHGGEVVVADSDLGGARISIRLPDDRTA